MDEKETFDLSIYDAKECFVLHQGGGIHFLYGTVGGFAVLQACTGERWPIPCENFYKEYTIAPTDFFELLQAYIKSPGATLEGTEWLWSLHRVNHSQNE